MTSIVIRVDGQYGRVFAHALRSAIGIRTELAYHIPDVREDNSIIIPIDVLSNRDAKTEEELRKDRIADLKKFLKSGIDYTMLPMYLRRSISLLEDVPKVYIGDKEIRVKNPFTSGIRKAEILDEGEFIQVVSPYDTSSIIAFDYSRPYVEMSFSYNALHFFEHIMCSPWVTMKGGVNNRLITMNGFTNDLGLCFVYSACSDRATSQKYLDAEIDFINEARKNGFKEEDIKREVSRTISETKGEPYLACFARNSGKTFNDVYDEAILRYWVNQPIKCFIVSPWKLDIKKLVKAKKVNRPSIPRFKTIPYEVFLAKSSDDGFVRINVKTKPAEIAKKIEETDARRLSFMGVDVVSTYYHHDKKYEGMYEYLPIYALSTCRGNYSSQESHHNIIRRDLLRCPDSLSILDAV